MHVLIVDDEVKLVATLKRGLEEQGHAVAVAYDGQTGLALAETGSFDVVVLDVLLPQLNGLGRCSSNSEAADRGADHHAHRPRHH